MVFDNNAKMLKNWALNLAIDAAKLSNGVDKLNEAVEKIKSAIRALPGEYSQENIEEYLYLFKRIGSIRETEMVYLRNLRTLKQYDKDELITIAGMEFYDQYSKFSQGHLTLVKEPDNKFDSDAIAIYVDDVKIGYVANSEHTTSELTSSASEIYDKIGDSANAEYLVHLRRTVIDFRIARVIL